MAIWEWWVSWVGKIQDPQTKLLVYLHWHGFLSHYTKPAEFSFHVLVYLFLCRCDCFSILLEGIVWTCDKYLNQHSLQLFGYALLTNYLRSLLFFPFLYYYEITKYGAWNFAVGERGILGCAGLLYGSHATRSMKCCKVDLLCSSWKCNQSEHKLKLTWFCITEVQCVLVVSYLCVFAQLLIVIWKNLLLWWSAYCL